MTPYYPGNPEYPGLSIYSWPESPSISQRIEAGTEIDDATRQRPKTFQQNYQRKAEQNEDSHAGLAQSKSGPQSHWNIVETSEAGDTC